MDILLSIAIALMAGLLLTRLIKPLGLPAVTGYLIAGVLVGPYCLGALGRVLSIEGLGFTSMDYVSKFTIISEVALGFIAFSIGNEFRLTQLKKIGKQATVIGIFQALTATLFVDVALCILSLILGSEVFPMSVAITLGAVATATAPAATLMVVRQYKAKGKLTERLLPVVALDDAVGLVIFAISLGIAKALSAGSISVVSVLVNPILEIFLSLGMGMLLGWIFSEVEIYFNSNSKRLSLAAAFVVD